MKTAILSGIRPVIGLARAVWCGVAVVVLTATSSLWATPVVTTLGGGISGSGTGDQDGQTLYALFHTPIGIAVDQGNDSLFVADRDNNAVRYLDLTGGNTYTFATQSISAPVGVTVDSFGDVFVLNRGGTGAFQTNGMVLEFDPYSDLIATNATHLTNVMAMTMDLFGNLYVTADTNLVLKITNSAVSTVAQVISSNVLLAGLSVLPNGKLAVADFGRNGIYTIDPNTGIVTTNAGFNGAGDGTGVNNHGVLNASAKFFEPYGVAATGDGSIVVCDYGNHKVKVVTAGGTTTNFYGVTYTNWLPQFPGWKDGTVGQDILGGVAGRLPAGIAMSADGGTIYTTEDYYHLVRMASGTFRPLPPLPPNPPTGLTATLITNVQTVEVLLNWNADPVANGVTNYVVERSTSHGGPYTVLASVGTATTFTDNINLLPGSTYYYVIQAENAGGEGPNSTEASATIPVPPPPPPQIGWYDFEGNILTGFFSTNHVVTVGNPFNANNPINIAVNPATNNVFTFYLTVPSYTNTITGSNIVNNGSTPPTYLDNQLFPGNGNVNPLPPLPLSNGTVIVYAVNKNAGGISAVASAAFVFQMGTPIINAPGGNAARFTITDVSTNAIFFYTLDGSDPTNAPASQQIFTTNGTATISLNGNTNIFFQVRAVGYGAEAGYQISGIAQQFFSPAAFIPNTLTWGFASGECSSKFIGAAGQTFLAPITLTALPGQALYSMQFNMTINNSGVGVTNPAPAPGPFSFFSMLMKPIPGTQPPIYTNIPPLMFANFATNLSLADMVFYNGTNYVDLQVSNGNELAVGWLERFGFANLYNTLQQNLLTFSLAHDDLFPNAGQNEPNGVIVGAYSFKLSPSAVNGQQYQILLRQASGTSDGVGAPGANVFISTSASTNASSMGPGTLNALKIVTVGSAPYVVGNVYPFGWFNAGDFGDSNLQSADIQQVFNSAVYNLNTPPFDPNSMNSSGGFTNVCDMYDAMDSSGQLGFPDLNPADPLFGYYTNAGPGSLTLAQENQMYLGNYSLINSMAFGDGKLDVSDVFLTYLRSQFTNNFVWFQRLWTNGVRVATATPAWQIVGGDQTPPQPNSDQPAPISITNTPFVNFCSTDIVGSAGQTVSIPINASVFGPYPMRMLLLNISVVPLDGSPALTTAIQFAPNSALATAFGGKYGSTPYPTGSSGNGNVSAAWLPNTFPSLPPGFTNAANIGTLTVTLPTNATSTSAYAIHFDHASASPSGLLSFPNRKFTGLITLSSRTNSYYNDGIPDSWRLKYFGTIYNQLSCSNADADGTGMNNAQKYHAGLDPQDPTSVFSAGSDGNAALNPHDMVLYWPSVAGKTYVILRSTTLFPPNWIPLSTNIGDGTYMEIHDPAGNSGGYYKVTTK